MRGQPRFGSGVAEDRGRLAESRRGQRVRPGSPPPAGPSDYRRSGPPTQSKHVEFTGFPSLRGTPRRGPAGFRIMHRSRYRSPSARAPPPNSISARAPPARASPRSTARRAADPASRLPYHGRTGGSASALPRPRTGALPGDNRRRRRHGAARNRYVRCRGRSAGHAAHTPPAAASSRPGSAMAPCWCRSPSPSSRSAPAERPTPST